MNKQEEQLHFDFSADKGTCLRISRTLSWSREELNPIELRMLQHHPLPSLLPVHLEEIDGRVQLLYALNGKKRLAQRLRREPLTQQQYFTMMLHVVSVLADCLGYMLNEDRVLLQTDYIFTGPDITDLFFSYLPVDTHTLEGEQLEQLRSFSTLCLGSVQTMEGSSIPRLLAGLREERISYTALKELLLTLLEDEVQSSPHHYNRPIALPFQEEEAAPKLQPTRPAWIPVSAMIPVATPTSPNSFPAAIPSTLPVEERSSITSASIPILPGAKSWMKKWKDLKDEIGPSVDTSELPFHQAKQEKKMEVKAGQGFASWKPYGYASAAALASLVLIWSFYSDASSSTELMILIGLSLLVVGALGWFFKSLRGRSLEDDSKNDADRALQRTEEELEASELPSIWSSSVNVTNESILPPQRTQLPASSHLATILLNSHSPVDMAVTSPISYSLIVWLDSTQAAIPLKTDVFLIGRADGGADYPLEQPGVSKHHLELTRRDDAFCAQDLGSTNGSYLNGERMVPYKPYPLVNGDRLLVIRTQFLFQAD